MTRFAMYLPTRILFGQGMLGKLHEQAMPGKRALLVISSGKSTRANGYLERTEAELRAAGVEYALFDQVEANPLKKTIMEGARFAREKGCDFVVALGGGSVMDASKVIATMATNPGDVWDYMHGGTGKGLPIEKKPLPVIAITTTAGTGSEVDAWGVVNNEETHEKMGFGGVDALYPVIAVVDPELMTTVPPKFTAFQGFDALLQSVECTISKAANLMSDMYALTSIENVARNLATAVKNGGDVDAREKVAFGNTLSGVSMTISSCTSEHAMEHAMSAYHPELPHGAGLIMISKAYFTHFVDRHACDERFVRMARAMGLEGASQPADFITALTKLQEACGVSDLKMSDYGIAEDELDAMARNARETMGGLFKADPVAMSHEECVAIFRSSYR